MSPDDSSPPPEHFNRRVSFLRSCCLRFCESMKTMSVFMENIRDGKIGLTACKTGGAGLSCQAVFFTGLARNFGGCCARRLACYEPLAKRLLENSRVQCI